MFAARSTRERTIERARATMLARGITEAWCTSLVTEAEAAACAKLLGDDPNRLLRIANPMSREGEVMRPGTTWGEVEEKVCAVAKGTKYGVELLLHGRGLGNDGPMLIPTDTHAHVKDDPLRVNTVFILKPYAYLAGETRYDPRHTFEVQWGDSVVVRDHGAERLGTRPHELVSVA